jgi:hypothetical protein
MLLLYISSVCYMLLLLLTAGAALVQLAAVPCTSNSLRAAVNSNA